MGYGYERITEHTDFDGKVRDIHEYRYKLAGEYTLDTDVVLDAACGTGYGKKFLKGKYIGVDRHNEGADIIADLHEWIPDFSYDVFVTIETIEHLITYQQHIDNAKKANRIIVASVPSVPTVVRDRYGNPDIRHYHVNDFTMDDLRKLFVDENWELIHEENQLDRIGIVVLKRKHG